VQLVEGISSRTIPRKHGYLVHRNAKHLHRHVAVDLVHLWVVDGLALREVVLVVARVGARVVGIVDGAVDAAWARPTASRTPRILINIHTARVKPESTLPAGAFSHQGAPRCSDSRTGEIDRMDPSRPPRLYQPCSCHRETLVTFEPAHVKQ